MSRGHPLVALLAVLGGWVGGRAATWEGPTALPPQAAAASVAGQAPGFVIDGRGGPQSVPGAGEDYDASQGYAAALPSLRPVAVYGNGPYLRYAIAAPGAWGGAGGPSFVPTTAGRPYPAFAPRHLQGDFSGLEPLPRFYAPEPPGMPIARPAAGSAAPAVVVAPARPRRWSADAWALLRRDESGALASPGALPATYGASQAGAVLRYRLALASRYRPTFYMRTTSTMGLLRETSAALGASARPLPSFPVIAAVEGRITDQGGRRRFQPAVMAVTELPPFALPAGFRGEAYGQGGYVAGRFATPFADGQFRADHALLDVGQVRTRIGAGVWGGVQKGAARLDAGPSASVMMPLGRGTTGRVAVDWRFRLVGDAVPDSGPALTLSAGF